MKSYICRVDIFNSSFWNHIFVSTYISESCDHLWPTVNAWLITSTTPTNQPYIVVNYLKKNYWWEERKMEVLKNEIPVEEESVLISDDAKAGLVLVDIINGFCTVGAGSLVRQINWNPFSHFCLNWCMRFDVAGSKGREQADKWDDWRIGKCSQSVLWEKLAGACFPWLSPSWETGAPLPSSLYQRHWWVQPRSW